MDPYRMIIEEITVDGQGLCLGRCLKSMYGAPPDWTGEKITCPNCGKEYRIDSQDWD